MNIRIHLLLAAGAVMLLAACTPPTATETTADPTQTPGENGEGYPAPEYFEPPYPVEDIAAEIFEQHLTPNAPEPVLNADTGALTAILYYPDGQRPVRGQLMLAAAMIPVQGVEDGYIPALDAENDPSGYTDAVGVLVISGIAPGEYALTLMTPLGPILIEDNESGEAIIFEVFANQLTDLGDRIVFLDAETLEP